MTPTLVFIIVGLLLTAVAVVAVISTVRAASKVESEDPEVQLTFTEKFAILNSK